MSDDPEHLPKVMKAKHRHAAGYVEREGRGVSLRKHEHADGTVHDEHAVAPNEWNNPGPDGWGAVVAPETVEPVASSWSATPVPTATP